MYYKANIEKQTLKNNNYRKVISTTTNMQLVLMSIEEGEEIGLEKHRNASQFIRVESGTAKAIVGKSKFFLKDGDAIIVPPNTLHNIINTGAEPLKIYTVYSPPQHGKNTVEKIKMD